MTTFQFDPDASAEENIQGFLAYLESTDPKLGRILKEEINAMTPLPEGQQRTAVRTAFNNAVIRRLDEDPTDTS